MRSRISEGSTLWGKFAPGDAVTVDIYDMATGSKEVSAAACHELASTGLFTYKPSLAPAGFTEYIYIMSNGHQSLYGSFDLGGYPDELVSQGEGLEQDIGGLQGDVTAVKAVTDTLSWADIDILIDLVGGNRLIQNNQMIYLSADGQTEVARFNLFDENGSPSEANIYRRERVL
jgi:hypothetical protein